MRQLLLTAALGALCALSACELRVEANISSKPKEFCKDGYVYVAEGQMKITNDERGVQPVPCEAK
jgi:hypothetical protein